jgi:transposase
LNSFDPETYLRAVLDSIVDHAINRVAELLPWNLHIEPLQATA